MTKKTSRFEKTTHKDIIKTVAAKHGLSQALMSEIFRDTFNEITGALYAGTHVTIPRFATFELSDVEAHKARNPRTGEEVHVPKKVIVKMRRRKGLIEVPNKVK